MKLHVMLVDDDEVFILLQKVWLVKSELSDDPQSFLNGKRALDYLNEHWEEAETFLIFLDINMPVMNAWEFLDALQSTPFVEKVLVIIVTSSVDTKDRKKAAQYPQVIDFIEKPLNIDTFYRIKQLPQVAPLL